MKIVTDIQEWQSLRRGLAKNSLGFVPTMGHLHEGHIHLCQRARQENDVSVVSIFVNPTQFNVASDFEAYKRTLEQDCHLLEKAGIDYVFFPDAGDMYADKYEVRVSETALSSELEGEFRPGHFTGMLTVVMKLLNIIQPTRAYFGEKDYQQLMLVEKMAEALFMPVDIVACPTVRAQSGLALSSRNARLTEDQQAKAALLYFYLTSDLSDEDIKKALTHEGFRVEYITSRWGRRLAAAWLENVRLIDNIDLADIQKEKEKAKHVIGS